MTLRNDELIELLFSVLLPPVGVFLRRGCGPDLVVNILLTVLGYIPGKQLHHLKLTLTRFLSFHSFALLCRHHSRCLDHSLHTSCCKRSISKSLRHEGLAVTKIRSYTVYHVTCYSVLLVTVRR